VVAPLLDAKLRALPEDESGAGPRRDDREILEEILEIVRIQGRAAQLSDYEFELQEEPTYLSDSTGISFPYVGLNMLGGVRRYKLVPRSSSLNSAVRDMLMHTLGTRETPSDATTNSVLESIGLRTTNPEREDPTPPDPEEPRSKE
jgi:hypothetical protein